MHRPANLQRSKDSGYRRAADYQDTEDDVSQILSRLSIQAALHGRGPTHQDSRHTSALRHSSFATFSNVQQARDALNSLLVQSLGSDNHVSSQESLASTTVSRISGLLQWASRFKYLLHGPLRNASPGQLRPLLVLRITNIIAIILSVTTDSGTETSFDEHLLQFQEIVRLGLSITNADSSPLPSDPQVVTKTDSTSRPLAPEKSSTPANSYIAKVNPWADSFTFDIGIIPAIYYTVLKCRCPNLRRQALDLLLEIRPRREGLWDALLLQRVARRAMEFEESDCLLPIRPADPDTWPMEEQRIHGAMLLPATDEDGAQRVGFTWRPNGLGGAWENWEEPL